MKRLHLFELEDQTWFPNIIRDLATDYLRFAGELAYPFGRLEELVSQHMKARDVDKIVDLCSGGAGPILRFTEGLRNKGFAVDKVTLTDKFPNQKLIDTQNLPSGTTYRPESVDALAVPKELTGVRTMFNAFHHFRPQQAQGILQDAVDKNEPIVIVEMVERAAALPLLILAPIMTIFTVPLVKPFRLIRFVFNWLIPIVPFVVGFDGFISCLRVYDPKELEELVNQLDNPNGYEFEIGRYRRSPADASVTYLIGVPKI